MTGVKASGAEVVSETDPGCVGDIEDDDTDVGEDGIEAAVVEEAAACVQCSVLSIVEPVVTPKSIQFQMVVLI